MLGLREELDHPYQTSLYFYSHVGVYVVGQNLVEFLHLCDYLLDHQADIRICLEVGWHCKDSVQDYFVSFSDKLQNRDQQVDVVGAEYFFEDVFEGLGKVDCC